MLQNIREKFTGTFALVVLALLAIPFVFVGVGANYSFLGGNFAATVDGEEIALGYFEARYRDIVASNPQLAFGRSHDRQRAQLLHQWGQSLGIGTIRDHVPYGHPAGRLLECRTAGVG